MSFSTEDPAAPNHDVHEVQQQQLKQQQSSSPQHKDARNVGLSTIEQALEALRQGKFVVVMDNEDRENEGDLIMVAQFATEESLAFMIRNTTGIVCVPMLQSRVQQLQLPLMVEQNTENHQCKFTITVDLREGTSTGVSASDRAKTIRALADPNVSAQAFNRPGHIFPLLAVDGGVLQRAGHTEATVDLARLAGFAPIGYICEMNDANGRMMRRPQLEEFAQKHDLPLVTISDLIRYRVCHENLIKLGSKKQVQTPFGPFDQYTFSSVLEESQRCQVLVFGRVAKQRQVLVHLIPDSQNFDAVLDAQFAQRHIAQSESTSGGMVIYMENCSKLLKVSGEFMASQCFFGIACQIARQLDVASIKLLVKNQPKFDVNGFGIEIEGTELLQLH